MTHSRAAILGRICDALAAGDRETATSIARRDYPFVRGTVAARRYSAMQCMRLFVRDGFIDRYSGARLICPATLRLLSIVLPEEFPAHPNWKMTDSHSMFWELFPTIDHVVPVARGGADAEANWVTTSMLRNNAKANWTLDELGWTLHAPGDPREWDGLTRWFVDMVARDRTLLGHAYLRRWHSAALRTGFG
jgi:hypothetical protein